MTLNFEGGALLLPSVCFFPGLFHCQKSVRQFYANAAHYLFIDINLVRAAQHRIWIQVTIWRFSFPPGKWFISAPEASCIINTSGPVIKPVKKSIPPWNKVSGPCDLFATFGAKWPGDNFKFKRSVSRLARNSII